MSPRYFAINAGISTLIWALVIFIMLARGELPEGMHQMNVIRVDTVVFRPYFCPALDSMRRADSVKAERKTK